MTLDGRRVHIGDFEDKTVMLNFWATWCAPCVKEFPILIGIAEEYKDDVVFIALSSDLEQNAIDRFLAKLEKDSGISVKADNILIALDENQAVTQKIFQTYRLPETVLIDKHQKLRQKITGADWRREDITSVIETFNQEP
ncbi:MAG: TlpA disulfide reductase family protein [Alphaproteobacteria bacterium]